MIMEVISQFLNICYDFAIDGDFKISFMTILYRDNKWYYPFIRVFKILGLNLGLYEFVSSQLESIKLNAV